MKKQTIAAQIKQKENQIKKNQNDIINLQKKCRHPKLQGKREGNTGNWDPNDDSYSIYVECPSCGWYDSAYYTNHGEKSDDEGMEKFDKLEKRCKYIWCRYEKKYVLND